MRTTARSVSFPLAASPIPLYLVATSLASSVTAPAAPPPIDHVLIVDVSGSMSGSLGLIADQIRNRLPTMMQLGHTLSVIRFSGRKQVDTVFIGREITGQLGAFDAVADAIRRLLVPVGMTAFVDPLVKARSVVADLRAKHPGHVIRVYLQTDGDETEGYSEREILDACRSLAGEIERGDVIEYGPWANRRLCGAMAAALGGAHVPCASFVDFNPAILRRFNAEGAGSARKVTTKLDGVPFVPEPFALVMGKADASLYEIDGDGAVTVPASTSTVYHLSAKAVGDVSPFTIADIALLAAGKDAAGILSSNDLHKVLDAAYAVAAVLVQRIEADAVFALLGALGDVGLVRAFENAFTKPEYDAAYDVAKAAAFSGLRFAQGRDASVVPRPDAWTVLQTLGVLREDPDCRLVLDDPAHPFVYSRIGPPRVETAETVKADVLAELCAEWETACAGARSTTFPDHALPADKALDFSADLLTAMEKFATVRTKLLDAIKTAGVKLAMVEQKPVGGYRIDGLVMPVDRANCSIRVQMHGTVDVTPAIPVDAPWAEGITAESFTALLALPTKTYRSYAVVRDGVLNITKLPVRLGKMAWAALAEHGMVSGPWHDGVVELDLSRLPVINRQMATSVRAADLVRWEYESIRLGAERKVLDHYLDTWPGSPGLAEQFGAEMAGWLASVGVRDSGFNPPTTRGAVGDVLYVAKFLKVGVTGLSSLPKVSEVRDRLAAITAGEAPPAPGTKKKAGKAPTLTPGMALMAPTLAEVDAFVTANGLDVSKTDAAGLAALEPLRAWLKARVAKLDARDRDLAAQLSRAAFVIVAGNVRPTDLKPGQTAITVQVGDAEIVGKIEPKTKPITA